MRVQTQRNETARLTFVAEWFHIVAGITHTYQLTFHLSDGGVEVVSSVNHLKISVLNKIRFLPFSAVVRY